MKRFVLLFVLVVRLSFVHAQNNYPDAKECYPDCNFTFQEIENELRPTFSTSNIIDAKAIEIIAKKMEQFRTEDANKFHLLKNKYCAALNGWIQNGECLHGGPPPCCNSPAGVVPWKRVGADKAKTALYAEWHQMRDKRNKDMELEVRNGYNVSRAQLFTQFNALYKQSTECTKILRDDAAYYKKNAVAVNQYIARMSNLYTEMKGYIDIKLSSAQQVQNVQFTTTEMEKLGTEICKAGEEVFQGKVFDPLLTQHNNLYNEFPFQKETLSRARVNEAESKSSASNFKSTETPIDVTNEQNALASNEGKLDVDFSQPQPKPIVRSKSVKVDPKQEIKKETIFTDAPLDSVITKPKHLMSIGLNFGLPSGVGLDFAYKLADHWTARVGLNYAELIINNYVYTATTTNTDGSKTSQKASFNGNVKMSNAAGFIEFTPGEKGRFKIIGGAHYFPNNTITVGGKLISAIKFNDVQINPEDLGSGTVTIGSKSSIAPYLGIGFGRTFPRKRLNVSFDMGAYYRGDYSFKINVDPGIILKENEDNAAILERNFNQKWYYKIWPDFNLRVAYRL